MVGKLDKKDKVVADMLASFLRLGMEFWPCMIIHDRLAPIIPSHWVAIPIAGPVGANPVTSGEQSAVADVVAPQGPISAAHLC